MPRKLLSFWLSPFRWYRKRIGGRWYKIVDPSDVTAWHSPTPVWVQGEPKEGVEVLAREDYATRLK